MAVIRAIMRDVAGFSPVPPSSFMWTVNWGCLATDGSGSTFTLMTDTVIANGDTAAVTASKIIDSVVALAASQGHTLARTNVYLIDYVRGS